MTTQTLFIGGRWRDGAAQRPIRCPYDGSLAGSMSEARHDDVLEAIEHARMGSVELGAAARAAVLTGAAERLASRRMEFARLIVAEAGTALKDALREVERALSLLLGYAEEAKRMQGQCVGTDVTPDAPRRLAISWRVPVGVVFAVTPFNRQTVNTSYVGCEV